MLALSATVQVWSAPSRTGAEMVTAAGALASIKMPSAEDEGASFRLPAVPAAMVMEASGLPTWPLNTRSRIEKAPSSVVASEVSETSSLEKMTRLSPGAPLALVSPVRSVDQLVTKVSLLMPAQDKEAAPSVPSQ